jgi:hypothetical protein
LFIIAIESYFLGIKEKKMERLIFDGSTEYDDSVLYTFVSESLDDAEDIFYELYGEDIRDVAKEYMMSDRDTLYGLSVSLEVNKETNEVEYKTVSLGIESDADLTEYEVADIELDDEIVELLLSKVKD